MVNSKTEKAICLIDELEQVLIGLSDEDYDPELFEKVDSLLQSILDPNDRKKHSILANFLLYNKRKFQFIAYIWYVIIKKYSFKGSKDGQELYVSPNYVQWYDDGVMFLEGNKPFSGYIGLYQNDEVKYAISTRDAEGGEILTKDDFKFISIDDAQKLSRKLINSTASDLRLPIYKLNQMLQDKEESELRYQEWIEEYHWVLGLQYILVQRHSKFDDENIPDFTAIRVHDKGRDIYEIKQPFLNLFRQDGKFSSEFNDSWNQIERYLDFTRENKEYLRRNKGINIESPKCYLIIGYNLTPEERKNIRSKEKLNTAITVLTYNDLIQFAENTITFLETLRETRD